MLDMKGEIDYSQYDDKEHVCKIPSGFMEFFEIASEAWFLCLAWDLAVSVTNPFSTIKTRYGEKL
jgi:hypothetical protein